MTPNNLVHENERLDELHRNGYYIIQDPARFCFGMDAVLLSGFARARRGERVLDLGTGTGIIPILMEAKTEAEDFTALEIQEESADMARRSVLYNHLEEKIRVVTGDIKDASGIFGASSFDIVTTNPPYMIGQHGISSGAEAKAIARHEVLSVPACGDYEQDGCLRHRTQADAAGLSICGQGAEHGSAGGKPRRQIETDGGKAADRL